MQDVGADTKKRGPSSRVLQEIIQAPAEHVTVGWLTSTFPRHSFGVIMLCLGRRPYLRAQPCFVGTQLRIVDARRRKR